MTALRWFWAERCLAYEANYWETVAMLDRYAQVLSAALDR